MVVVIDTVVLDNMVLRSDRRLALVLRGLALLLERLLTECDRCSDVVTVEPNTLMLVPSYYKVGMVESNQLIARHTWSKIHSLIFLSLGYRLNIRGVRVVRSGAS